MVEWVGVDLDGTLAESARRHLEPGEIGRPVPKMIAEVKHLLSLKYTVKIFTARVASRSVHAEIERAAIRQWTAKHLGRALEATAEKDVWMKYYYDDKAVTVQADTGVILTRGWGGA